MNDNRKALPPAAVDTPPKRAVVPAITLAGILTTALCDLPIKFKFGSLSGTALLSAAVAGLGIITLPALFKQRITVEFLPFAALAIWATLLTALVGPNTAGLQNLTIYWMFLSIGILTATFVNKSGIDRIQKLLLHAGWALVALYGLGLLLSGPGSSVVLSRRSFALTALILIAFAVPIIDRGRLARWLPWALFLLIAASLSRTALAVAALLVALRAAYTQRGLRLARTMLLIVSAGIFLIWAIQQNPVLNERFTGGDRAFQVGGVTISSQGRDAIWGVVISDVGTAPIAGHGPGAVSALITSHIPSQTEPHNDFLRVLYDTGLVGLTLFVTALGALLIGICRRALRTEDIREKARHTGAGLALVAFIGGATTDNPLVYSFVMAPLAVIVGLSLATRMPPKKPDADQMSEAVREIATSSPALPYLRGRGQR